MKESEPPPVPGTVSDVVTHGIRVQARSIYVPERSSERDQHYFFAYTIQISNEGGETAQLLAREWVITDGDGKEQTVVGPGVVGEKPVLEPGGSFEYQSFCPLSTPVGSMHGSYQFVTGDGRHFQAAIAPFTLAVPTALN